MDLRALLAEVEPPSVAGDAHRTIEGIAHDSREVRPGFLFAALRGLTHDGHDFIGDAVTRGAVALIVDRPVPPVVSGATLVRVADSRRALGQISAAFYGHPSRRLRAIGVTGTNGKGATTFLIDAILRRAGRPCGIIGTMGIVID